MSKRSPARTEKAEVLPSVKELKAVVVREHKAALVAARTTLAHAVRAGEALLQIRDILMLTDEWTSWIENDFPLNRSQGYLYMRLAHHKDLIPPKVESLSQAERLIAGLPSYDGSGSRARVDSVKRGEAERWRAEDPPVPWKQIAKRLDVSVSTVYNWFYGAKGQRRYRQRQKKAQQLLKESEELKEAQRLASKNETALSEAYTLTERLRDVLGQARLEADTTEGIKAIKRAEEYNHVAHDSVVEALGEEA
jgi:transposase